MNAEHHLVLGEITYLMRPANALPAWNALKKAARLLQGLQLSTDSGSESLALGAILANLGDPVVAEVENLVLQHTSVQPANGTAFRLSERVDAHFNQHREHLIPVLIEGVKYQFADFFTGAMPALSAIMPKQAEPMV